MEESSKSQVPSSKEAPSSRSRKGSWVTPEFQLGEMVYSAIEQSERGMVISIEVSLLGCSYRVAWAERISEPSYHYAIELSREPLFTTPTR
jgi:hypothetical protein